MSQKQSSLPRWHVFLRRVIWGSGVLSSVFAILQGALPSAILQQHSLAALWLISVAGGVFFFGTALEGALQIRRYRRFRREMDERTALT